MQILECLPRLADSDNGVGRQLTLFLQAPTLARRVPISAKTRFEGRRKSSTLPSLQAMSQRTPPLEENCMTLLLTEIKHLSVKWLLKHVGNVEICLLF